MPVVVYSRAVWRSLNQNLENDSRRCAGNPPTNVSSSAPSQRWQCDAFVDWPNVFVYGGRTSIGAIARELWRYSIVERTWTKVVLKADGGSPMVEGHAIASVDGTTYIFGGLYCRTGCPFWLLDVDESVSRISLWKPTEISSQINPGPRRNHTLTACGSELFLFGGYIDLFGSTDQLWRFDTEVENWSRLISRGGADHPNPIERHHHTTVAFDGQLYVLGGIQNLKLCRGGVFFCSYSIANNVWRRVQVEGAEAPPPRYGHSSCVVGATMVVFGGVADDDCLLNDLWCFRFGSHSWTRMGISDGVPNPLAFSCLMSLCPDETKGVSRVRRTAVPQRTEEERKEEPRDEVPLSVCYLVDEDKMVWASFKKNESSHLPTHVPQKSASDSGIGDDAISTAASDVPLLSRSGRRPDSIDSRSFIANPAFERSDSDPSLAAEETCFSLPGSIEAPESRRDSSRRHPVAFKRNSDRRRELDQIPLTRLAGPEMNGWMSPTDDETEPVDAPVSTLQFGEATMMTTTISKSVEDGSEYDQQRRRLCDHTDDRCFHILLMGGKTKCPIPQRDPLNVYVCCLRR